MSATKMIAMMATIGMDFSGLIGVFRQVETAADGLAEALGLPTRAQMEQQRRVERHLARCAMRRERRRRQ